MRKWTSESSCVKIIIENRFDEIPSHEVLSSEQEKDVDSFIQMFHSRVGFKADYIVDEVISSVADNTMPSLNLKA